MPLTPKGRKIEHAMEKEYGAKKGKQVFYASKNKGTIKGVEGKKKHMAHLMKENEKSLAKNKDKYKKESEHNWASYQGSVMDRIRHRD